MKRTLSLVLAALALTAAAPSYVPVHGVLTDASGKAITTLVAVRFSLHDAKTAGTELWFETQNVTPTDGVFTAYLGQGKALDLATFKDHGDLWLEVKVGSDEAMERFQLGSAAFGAYAEYCGNVPVHAHAYTELTGSVPTASLPAGMVVGAQSCAVATEKAKGFDAAGKLQCGAVAWGDVTGKPAGLVLGQQACTGTNKVKGIKADGTVDCDVDQTATAGGGITGSGNVGQVPYFTTTSSVGGSSIAVDGAGKVGIGTISPSSELSVRGNADFGATSASATVPSAAWGYGALNFPRGQMMFSNTNAQNQLYLVSNGQVNSGSTWAYRNTGAASAIGLDSGVFQVFTAPSGTAGSNLDFAGNVRLYVTNAGNVGIGTTTPGSYPGSLGKYRLEVNGKDNDGGNGTAILVNAGAGLSRAGGTWGQFSIATRHHSGTEDSMWYFAAGSQTGKEDVVSIGKVGNTNPGSKLVIADNGNVGIGTGFAPAARLEIATASATTGDELLVHDGRIRIDRVHIDDKVGLLIENGNTMDGQPSIKVTGSDPMRDPTMVHLELSTARPDAPLIKTVNGGAVFGGNVGIGTATTTGGYKLRVVGGSAAVDTGQSWTTASDVRLKQNITPLSSVLDKIQGIRLVRYDARTETASASGHGRHMGVIAQELEREFPELVVTGEDGLKAVAYDKLSAVAIQAAKDLKTENDALRGQVARQAAEAKALEARLSKLEALLSNR